MIAAPLLAVFWVVIALIGALAGLAFVLGMGRAL